METKHTPIPWKWQGEDYRGGWGWQLLVGPDGQGIVCGQSKDGPYKNLRAGMPIDPEFCKTGFNSDEESAPGIHVQEADAAFIVEACNNYEGLKESERNMTEASMTLMQQRDDLADALGMAEKMLDLFVVNGDHIDTGFIKAALKRAGR
jgi:hypothetical protein